ncbi:MAG: AMP-binding protein [Mycetocola sp.]
MERLRQSTFSQYCLDAFRLRGNEIAFTYGDRHLTGFECLALAHALAAVLASHGVGRGEGVCVLSSNRPESFITEVASQMIGGRYTGLHPSASLADHQFVLQNSAARALVYDPVAFGERAVQIAAHTPGVQLFSLGPGPVGKNILALAAVAQPVTDPVALEDDIAFIFYTGGTSGKPKGVVHTQRSWYHQSLQIQAHWQWPHDPVLLVTAPITHAAGGLVAPALALGGRVVLVDGFEPSDFLRIVQQERVSVTFLVPTMIYKLLDHPETRLFDLSTIRTLVYGASTISLERLLEARALFGDVLLQGYGQTEIGSGSLLLLKQDHLSGQPDILASAGRTPPGVTAQIVDDDDRPVPPGQPGELCLRSASVMQGYWKLPELTVAALRGGWLHTEDIAVMDARGYITIVGRKKDMVVSGGFNVYPKEIEDALQDHPGVRSSAVVGVPHHIWGEAVVALVCLVEKDAADQDELKAWIRERKGPVCTPKEIRFADYIPETALGKVDKNAIRKEWANATALHKELRGCS